MQLIIIIITSTCWREASWSSLDPSAQYLYTLAVHTPAVVRFAALYCLVRPIALTAGNEAVIDDLTSVAQYSTAFLQATTQTNLKHRLR